MLYSLYLYESTTITKIYLKFIYGDGPNLCGVKIVDVSSTFIENIFRPGLTLVSSNDIITIKIDKKKFKFVQNHKKINKQKRLLKIIRRCKRRFLSGIVLNS